MTYKKQHKSKLKPHRNPYREAQANQRKAANQARQKVLQEQRRIATGEPIRSIPTPFIESLATGRMPDEPTEKEVRNFFLGPDELSKSLEYSKKLSAPYLPRGNDAAEPTKPERPTPKNANSQEASPSNNPPILDIEDPTYLSRLKSTTSTNPHTDFDSEPPTPTELEQYHKYDHRNAARALSLISSLTNGSSSDLTRHNIQRCISTFGRHNTDNHLPPRAPSIYDTNPSTPKLRAGPDTGSSEVQIAVLTAKINVLADNLNNKDKLNKRNLRLMVHKRQKLLAYLRRKERAGPRWRNLVEALGVQDAMWKGEISL